MDRLKKSENLQVNIEKYCINIEKDAKATQIILINLNIFDKDLPSWVCLFLGFVFYVCT